MLRKSPIPEVYSLSKMADIHGFQIRGDPKNHVSKSWDDPILQGPRLLNCWENFRRSTNTGAFQSPQNSTARNCWSTHVYLPTFTIKNQATVIKYIPSLKLTVRPLKMFDPWKRRILLETIIFRCYVSFQEGTIHWHPPGTENFGGSVFKVAEELWTTSMDEVTKVGAERTHHVSYIWMWPMEVSTVTIVSKLAFFITRLGDL